MARLLVPDKPNASLHVPAGQSAHDAAPAVLLIVPGSQRVHCASEVLLDCPARHTVHSSSCTALPAPPAPQHCPVSHCVVHADARDEVEEPVHAVHHGLQVRVRVEGPLRRAGAREHLVGGLGKLGALPADGAPFNGAL